MKRNLLIVFLSLTVSLSYADNWLIRFMKQLGETDTTYIEPQHYPGMLMLQNSYTFDRISLDDGKDKMVFAPDVSVGVGPFGGYKFFFAGYTVDMKSFFKSKDRTNLVFSIFTNPFVIDIYYRKAGNDFKLREITDPELKWIEGMDCSAITTRNFGFSFSYILNHKRYSAPAAFGQSTNQRRSAGSLIFGAGYMRSKFDFNLADMVYDMVKKSINDGTFDQMVLAEDIDTDEPDDDEDLIMTRNARFNTFSLTAGYGYNWAFAHNWLLGAAVFVNPGLKTCDAHMENVNDMMENIDRERMIQSGVHYSEMIPREHLPSEEYLQTFFRGLEKYSEHTARAAVLTAKKILADKGENILLFYRRRDHLLLFRNPADCFNRIPELCRLFIFFIPNP